MAVDMGRNYSEQFLPFAWHNALKKILGLYLYDILKM